MTGLVLYDRFRPAGGDERDRKVRNWPEYLDQGRRVGPDDASVVIVQFGDYQCPFCKELDKSIRLILQESPEDVALVYRHLPIPYHEHAYMAARFAECAREQGRFVEAHHYLNDLEDLDHLVAPEFAEEIGIASTEDFLVCAESTDPVAQIELDLAVVEDLGIDSTPTILVNGLLLARTPDLERLREIVASAQERH